MKKGKGIVTLTQYISGDFYFANTTLDKINVTKMLGGKDNIKKSKYWTHHGYGGWITEVRVIDIEKAKEAILANGCDYTIMKGDTIIDQSQL